jgi:hypothetical protein
MSHHHQTDRPTAVCDRCRGPVTAVAGGEWRRTDITGSTPGAGPFDCYYSGRHPGRWVGHMVDGRPGPVEE